MGGMVAAAPLPSERDGFEEGDALFILRAGPMIDVVVGGTAPDP